MLLLAGVWFVSGTLTLGSLYEVDAKESDDDQ